MSVTIGKSPDQRRVHSQSAKEWVRGSFKSMATYRSCINLKLYQCRDVWWCDFRGKNERYQ